MGSAICSRCGRPHPVSDDAVKEADIIYRMCEACWRVLCAVTKFEKQELEFQEMHRQISLRRK